MIFHSALWDIFYPARRAIIYLGQETILVTASAPGQGEEPRRREEVERSTQKSAVPSLAGAMVPCASRKVASPKRWGLEGWVCTYDRQREKRDWSKEPGDRCLSPLWNSHCWFICSVNICLWAPTMCKAFTNMLNAAGPYSTLCGAPTLCLGVIFSFWSLFSVNYSVLIVWEKGIRWQIMIGKGSIF